MTHNSAKIEKYLFPGISGCILAPCTGGPGESSCQEDSEYVWQRGVGSKKSLVMGDFWSVPFLLIESRPYPGNFDSLPPLPYIFWAIVGHSVPPLVRLCPGHSLTQRVTRTAFIILAMSFSIFGWPQFSMEKLVGLPARFSFSWWICLNTIIVMWHMPLILNMGIFCEVLSVDWRREFPKNQNSHKSTF